MASSGSANNLFKWQTLIKLKFMHLDKWFTTCSKEKLDDWAYINWKTYIFFTTKWKRTDKCTFSDGWLQNLKNLGQYGYHMLIQNIQKSRDVWSLHVGLKTLLYNVYVCFSVHSFNNNSMYLTNAQSLLHKVLQVCQHVSILTCFTEWYFNIFRILYPIHTLYF
jgi:hypothetical protein